MLSKIWGIFIICNLALLSPIHVGAQVTIGSGLEPIVGSILDLKETVPTANNVNSTKGIAMPRVILSTLNSLTDINIGTPITPQINLQHTGLVIYNVTMKGPICPGIYYWDGSRWNPLSSKSETITDLEGNVYSISKFGSAGYWMTQNLRSTYSTAIAQGTLTEGTGSTGNLDKRYYYPNNRATFDSYPEYGLLYTWGAATNGIFTDQFTTGAGIITSTVQGICPQGWVVPSDYDWNQLEIELATYPQLYSTNSGTSWDPGYSNASGAFRPAGAANGQGNTMKLAMNVSGISTPTNGLSFTVCQGNGFSVFLVGQYTSIVQQYGTQSYMWSSSSTNANNAWYRGIISGNGGVLRTNFGKYYMQSVRCKKAN